VDTPTIKSFKLRGTRITAAQEAARTRLWDTYGIVVSPKSLDLKEIFPGIKRFVVEIGFGMGEATVEIAKNLPDTGFLAIDVHQPGIGKLLSAIEETGVANIRVMDEDAHVILQNMIPDSSLDSVHLFFPDPWPKTRHHKRRIVNENFINLVASKLKTGGNIHMATDWAPYAKWMKDRFDRSPLYVGGTVERPTWRPLTRFEGQGIRKDHEVTDLIYTKI
jgi:tRNA (guanine-N7-)-methyltransferase